MTKPKYSQTENWNRNVRTIAEHSKKFPMTRKVDTYEYESLGECIRSAPYINYASSAIKSDFFTETL